MATVRYCGLNTKDPITSYALAPEAVRRESLLCNVRLSPQVDPWQTFHPKELKSCNPKDTIILESTGRKYFYPLLHIIQLCPRHRQMILLGASDRVESIPPEPVRHVDNDELR